MKKDLHPTYQNDITATCSCGNTFTVGSTQEKLDIEVCSACHPFYTGKQNLVDAAGRVDKFQQKLATAEEKRAKATKHAKDKRTEKKSKKDDKTVKLN